MTLASPDSKARPTVGPWPVRGDARGPTPKDLRRGDREIQEQVCESLTVHAEFDVDDIEVDVEQGEVTLSGTVRSRWAKLYAEDLAAGIVGVRDVTNEVRIVSRGA
jgi:osmotically-inducible protein OsmY